MGWWSFKNNNLKLNVQTAKQIRDMVVLPSACFTTWRILVLYCISRYVYVCNRPLAPILRQSRCSLMYDVY